MPHSYLHNIRPIIIQSIKESKQSIQAAVAWFNDSFIFEALLESLKRGVSVQIVLTNDSTNINQLLDWNLLGKFGGQVYIYNDKAVTMHHKFCIIDEKMLLLGSYNWTYRAHKTNKEDLIIFTRLDNFDISMYQSRFAELIISSDLITKNKSANIYRERVICETVKEFMINNGYISVIGNVKSTLSGLLFLILINKNEERSAMFFSIDAAKTIHNGQKLSKGFFEPFVVITEKITGLEPIITIALNEEWLKYNDYDELDFAEF